MKNNDRPGALSEINVTPLVDVMLVLLVVFMITAPMMSQRIDIDIPQTAEVPSSAISKDPLIVNINKNGTITIEDSNVPITRVGQKIKAIIDVKQDKQIYIRADRKTEYEAVAGVIAELKANGVDMVSLVSLPKK